MAKKKSSRFIIPASYFTSLVVGEKLDAPPTIIEKSKELVSEVKEDNASYPSNKSEEKHSIRIEEKEILKPQPLNIDLNKRRGSALSLSSIERNKKEKEKSKPRIVDNLDNLPKDPFTEESFLKVWNSYINELHNKGEKIFASILKADIPKIKNNFICVTYPNEMMKAELLKVKPKALNYLRKELNNYSIDFKVSVNEENAKKFAYTPQEKYDLLKEKNEAISKLRRTFNLEL
ncbi:MAG: hypothetical protein KAH67_05570 [Flavobacteriaceae bacterium]|nr:hypothetical protein [Flavobacteriaceae bacterium]